MLQTAGAIEKASEEALMSVRDISHETQGAPAVLGTAGKSITEISTATDQIGRAIRVIEVEARKGNSAANKAAGMARETEHAISELLQLTTKVDSVLGVVSQIAGQTNLLALNATIEAARWGGRKGICRRRHRGEGACESSIACNRPHFRAACTHPARNARGI